MRRVLVALLSVTCTAYSALPAGADVVSPSRGTHAFTTRDALVQVVDGPTDTHQATLDTRLYVPDNATTATPQPAILMTHGFGLTKLGAEVVSMATFLARHGYVVLTYTAQGFGSSTGCVTLQSRTYDVKDARQLITKVLETKPYVKKDAKGAVVGTVGGSYGGGIQLDLAEADSRIRAIAPGRTWNSLQYSLDPDNWVVPGDPTGFSHTLAPQGVFKQEWTSLFFASGNGNPVGGIPPSGNAAGSCPQDKLASGDPLTVAGLACPGFYAAVCQTYAELTATGDATPAGKALVADSSGSTEISRLRVPTLLVQGQRDTLFNVNDAAATYTALRRQHVPVQMIWNWGGHGGYDSRPGECEVYGGGHGGADYRGLDDCYLTLRTLTFFDHWLKGRPDTSPGFSWYEDWLPYDGTGASNSYASSSAFPLPAQTTYHLSGSVRLVRSGAVAGTVTIVNPTGGLPSAYSETSNFTGPSSSPMVALPPREVPGQHADFDAPPYPHGAVSVGIPTLRIQLAHVAPTDLVLFAKSYDVAPDGSAELIHRLVSPVRIPSSALAAPVTIKLIGFVHRFAAGHHLRLTLSTTDATSYNNKVADVITVTTGPATSLTLNEQVRSDVAVVVHPPHVPGSTGPDLAGTGLNVAIPVLALLLIGGALSLRRRR
jgi:ABC-2 type transport system ATP-binding protein